MWRWLLVEAANKVHDALFRAQLRDWGSAQLLLGKAGLPEEALPEKPFHKGSYSTQQVGRAFDSRPDLLTWCFPLWSWTGHCAELLCYCITCCPFICLSSLPVKGSLLALSTQPCLCTILTFLSLIGAYPQEPLEIPLEKQVPWLRSSVIRRVNRSLCGYLTPCLVLGHNAENPHLILCLQKSLLHSAHVQIRSARN